LYKLNCLDDTKIPIVNTVFRNLASLLPNVSSTGLVYNGFNCRLLYVVYYYSNSAHPVSAVISSQLSDTLRFNTTIPVELTFDLEEVSKDLYNLRS